jgi:hypothetical protein
MIDLILKDIEDPYIRENFFRLTQFINRQVWFEGDFQLYDVTIPAHTKFFKVRHGLTFIPTDIIPLAVEGDYNFFFRYKDFDAENMYIFATGPVHVRFLAGKLSDQIKNRFGATNLPFVAPGEAGPSSPGFVYGAVGSKTTGFWLTSEGIPSNVVGVPILFGDGVVSQIAVGTEIEADYTLGIYQHEGAGLNLSLVGQANVVSGGPKRLETNFPVTSTSPNVQLACRLLTGNTLNLKVSLVVKGSGI